MTLERTSKFSAFAAQRVGPDAAAVVSGAEKARLLSEGHIK